MYKSTLEKSVEMNMDKRAEEIFGEFGFDTCASLEQETLLIGYRNDLIDEIETLKDHDRLLQAIGAQKELTVVMNKLAKFYGYE